MSKGTFNQGWWNCFESFAAELLFQNNNEKQVILNVLSGAGITKKEASYWIDHYQGIHQNVLEIVRQYWLINKIKNKHKIEQ